MAQDAGRQGRRRRDGVPWRDAGHAQRNPEPDQVQGAHRAGPAPQWRVRGERRTCTQRHHREQQQTAAHDADDRRQRAAQAGLPCRAQDHQVVRAGCDRGHAEQAARGEQRIHGMSFIVNGRMKCMFKPMAGLCRTAYGLEFRP